MLALPFHITQQLVCSQSLERVPEPAPIMLGAERCAAYSSSARAENVSVVHDFCADIIADWRLPRAKVLDVACGGGQCLFTIAERFPEYELTGLDISPQMLEVCRARAKELGEERFQFLLCDMAEMHDVPDGAFDIATCAMAAHHTKDLDAVSRLVRELLRVTRPEGGVLLVDLGRLKTPALNRWYVEWKGRDYSPEFFTEFRDSMAAAFTAAEMRQLVASIAAPGLRHYAFSGLPVVQFVIRAARRGSAPLRVAPPRAPALQAEYRQIRQMFRPCGLSPQTHS